MTRRRIYISAILMTLAIIAIGFFQGYWLFKTYKEEKQTLSLRTNLLFREAIFETQASKFSMDTANALNVTNTKQAIRVIDNIKLDAARTQLKDSQSGKTDRSFDSVRVVGYGKRASNAPHPTLVTVRRLDPRESAGAALPDVAMPDHIEVKRDDSGKENVFAFNYRTKLIASNDSGKGLTFRANPAQRSIRLARDTTVFYRLLDGIDLTQDSITIPEIDKKFKSSLAREAITVSYLLDKENITPMRDSLILASEQENEVITGFSKPVKYSLHLVNTSSYLLNRMSSQIIISATLVALTIVSFLVLFRNLIRQRRLTELKNDFISNITHELKTPIATVSVAVEALKNFNALDDPKRTQEYLDISANELQRLSLLVDKVLRLSMFEKQQIELKNESFELNTLVHEVIASMRLQFEKYGAVVKTDFPPENTEISGDRMHITSVVYNLLDNALKYSKGKPLIKVSIKQKEDVVELEVEDNGAGIAPEYKDKIFEKFFRVPSGNLHNVKGYGLGLSYVAYVIERHNGNIDVESTAGSGSIFKISLPA